MDANASVRENVPRPSEDGEAADAFLFITMRFLPRPVKPAIQSLLRLDAMAGAIVRSASHEPPHKIELLDGLNVLLDGGQPAAPLAPAIAQAAGDFIEAARAAGGNVRHAQHILQARRQDLIKLRYRDWNELIAYSRYAASPYGRFGVEACGADKSVLPALEALCCALHVLLLLRDCGSDYREHGRVYLPERWFKEAGADIAALGADTTDEPLRQVFLKTLEASDRLLLTAKPLPALLRDRRLRAAAEATLCLIRRFTRRLRTGDPLAERLAPTAADRRIAVLRGHLAALWR